MNTLLVYEGKHGFTEKCARLLAEKIPGEVYLLDLRQEEQADPKNYDTLIVGGSVYMGKIRKEAAAYCRVHKQQLLKKKLGLFIYCANSEKAEEQAEGAYPAELLQHAAAVAYFGYAFILSG